MWQQMNSLRNMYMLHKNIILKVSKIQQKNTENYLAHLNKTTYTIWSGFVTFFLRAFQS